MLCCFYETTVVCSQNFPSKKETFKLLHVKLRKKNDVDRIKIENLTVAKNETKGMKMFLALKIVCRNLTLLQTPSICLLARGNSFLKKKMKNEIFQVFSQVR